MTAIAARVGGIRQGHRARSECSIALGALAFGWRCPVAARTAALPILRMMPFCSASGPGPGPPVGGGAIAGPARDRTGPAGDALLIRIWTAWWSGLARGSRCYATPLTYAAIRLYCERSG
jgi:hypothetical protein